MRTKQRGRKTYLKRKLLSRLKQKALICNFSRRKSVGEEEKRKANKSFPR
jgi:hypothetical protein